MKLCKKVGKIFIYFPISAQHSTCLPCLPQTTPKEYHLESPSSTPPKLPARHTRQNDAETNGTYLPSYLLSIFLLTTYPQLSKEDEAATGADEIEVRREDQDKINKFSRLHQRELNLEDELKAKHVREVPRIAGLKQRRRS